MHVSVACATVSTFNGFAQDKAEKSQNKRNNYLPETRDWSFPRTTAVVANGYHMNKQSGLLAFADKTRVLQSIMVIT